VEFPSFTQIFTLTRCSMLTRFRQRTRTQPASSKGYCQTVCRTTLKIVTVSGGETTSQYNTPLTVAKFTGKQKKIKSGYFIARPRIRL